MKYTKVIIILFLFFSCKTAIKRDTDIVQERKEIESVNVEEDNHKSNTEKDTLTKVENQKTLEFDVKEVMEEDMIGLSFNEEEKEVLKRYTYDVSGACYSCDIANIKFNHKEVILTNVCEDSEKRVFKIESIVKKEKTYEILFIQENQKVKLFIAKVEEVPIYSVQLDASFQEIDNFQINEFYMIKRDLKKLETHDCGEFEG
ncbi:hypothetical protein CSC81_09325 [Tenacibaculum discolor]|uniref:Uncharacterized protein n=1 Tax=Tenacibaculum discolor TaxID=361581 RepID=A0A2G1BUI6_9FLAO|nr:hypothetical protein [Tenacibaculum discolor]MDP2542588.1 hypothetical protein [Tenacibaculum discolor]PHN97275.1 hypothetical protein CSC81_09325 [Tenacibaculum discolor]PHO01080.1 hypothetical protein CSC82_25410 [Rhodobacteraceae bacterium 4F10]